MNKSKNSLLSEAQVRRMMGLAGIEPLSERYSSDMGAGGMYGDRDEDEPLGEPLGELPGEEELPLEEPGFEPELEEPGVPGEEGEGVAAGLSGEEKEDLAASIVRAVAQELEDALALPEPIEVAVEEEPPMGEPGLEPEEEELGLEPELELGAPGEEEEEELALQEDGTANKGHGPGKQATTSANKATGRWLKEEEEEEELAEVVDDEEIVNEVLRRVVARLAKR